MSTWFVRGVATNLSVALLVAACGGDDASDTPDESSSQAETSASLSNTDPSAGDPTTSPSDDTSASDDTSTTDDTSPSEDTSAGDDTTGEPPPVEVGAVCALDERIGLVQIWTDGNTAMVYGTVYDGPDPWIGPAELSNEACAFHRFSTSSCGVCDPGQVCAFSGQCVDQRLALTDATIDIVSGGETTSIIADPITGDLYGALLATGDDATVRLRYAGLDVELPALEFAADLEGAAIGAEGDAMTPDFLHAIWTPRDDGSRVRTVIPINHHAGGPTFTVCDVPTASGTFHADGEMLLPLAVQTGLEFQGLDVSQTAAVHTDAGCIEVRVGRQLYVDIEWIEV